MGLFDAAVPGRYESNPMLAVLENYVLDAIGKLEPEKAVTLNDIVCRTFGGTDWKKTIREQFGLPADADKQFKAAWKQAQEEADTKQEDVSAEQFARDIADDLAADTGN